MAEIIDSSYQGSRSVQAHSWIVMFNDESDKNGRQKHMDLVRRLNEHSAGIQPPIYYAGIQHVYDALKGYAGVFRPEVVDWIRSQGDIESVDPDRDAGRDA